LAAAVGGIPVAEEGNPAAAEAGSLAAAVEGIPVAEEGNPAAAAGADSLAAAAAAGHSHSLGEEPCCPCLIFGGFGRYSKEGRRKRNSFIFRGKTHSLAFLGR